MKSIEELLSRFNKVQELPVSEETLVAHLEGNLSEADSFAVEQMVELDDNLSEIVENLSEESSSAEAVSVPSDEEIETVMSDIQCYDCIALGESEYEFATTDVYDEDYCESTSESETESYENNDEEDYSSDDDNESPDDGDSYDDNDNPEI